MKPDLDAIRARCEAARVILDPRSVVMPCIEDIPALLAYIDELEGRGFLPQVNPEHEAIVDGMIAKAREGATRRPIVTYSPGETEWANRIAHAEARFVEEYDMRKAAERQVEELKARIVTLEAMKP